MKLASFKVDHLFDRAVGMNQRTLEAGKRPPEDVARLTEICAKTQYTAADKAEIMQRFTSLGLVEFDEIAWSTSFAPRWDSPSV